MSYACQRELFDLPDGLTYFNTASQSPCLNTSFSAGERGLRRKLHPWSADRAALPGEMERCRDLFGGLLGATADDVAIVFATSYGIASAAANLPLAPGQDVLMLEAQFPSNVYAWQRLADQSGGGIRYVPRGADFDWTGPVLEALDDGVGIVALPNCHWCDGALVDLEPISAECVRRGIPLIVDATQSIGVKPLNLETVPADFIVASGYKWLLCPDMMGFMYVAPKHQTGMPLELNHAARIDAPSMETGSGLGGRLKPNARRFDMGAADSMVILVMARRQHSAGNFIRMIHCPSVATHKPGRFSVGLAQWRSRQCHCFQPRWAHTGCDHQTSQVFSAAWPVARSWVSERRATPSPPPAHQHPQRRHQASRPDTDRHVCRRA